MMNTQNPRPEKPAFPAPLHVGRPNQGNRQQDKSPTGSINLEEYGHQNYGDANKHVNPCISLGPNYKPPT